ncbi:MAG: RagB/SusD family nutrient uptake outer membrane protein [Bacteroidetes bacterium]|nr:RagB/SusD family nutrient uptake outer membrane protein [Bacteroidota bacterium]
MKHIKFYSIIIPGMLLLLVMSCKKNSLLNQTPPTRLNDAAYWANVSDLQYYVNQFYSDGNLFPLYIEAFNYGPYQNDDNSDNTVSRTYNTRNNGLNTVQGSGGYANWYQIRNVNYFLANYSRVFASGTTLASAQPYIGEAYFFRAMYYFQALKSFGALPWINKPLNTSDSLLLYSSRLPRNIIADSIVQDLNLAIANLPSKSSAQKMRLYKEYAQAYKARVCLYEGTWEKYHATDVFGVSGQQGSDFLKMAADAADSVISSGKFSLDNQGSYSGYWKLFNQTDYSGSKEIIFWAAENYAINGGNSSQGTYQGGLGSSTGLSKSLVDDYLCTDGSPIATSSLYKGDDSISHVVANRDPRLRQTVLTSGDTIVLKNPVYSFSYPALFSTSPCTTGYQLYKGLNTDPSTNPSSGRTSPVPGIIYMRYAEVLLTYAEAKVELGNGTISQADVDKSINVLRDRVGMPHLIVANISTDPNWLFPNLSAALNEIRRERRVELACEGFRFDDICRWAAAGTLIKGKIPVGAQIGQFMTVDFGSGVHPIVGTNIYVNSANYISPYGNVPQMASGYQFNLGRDYLLPIDLQDATLTGQQNPGWQ